MWEVRHWCVGGVEWVFVVVFIIVVVSAVFVTNSAGGRGDVAEEEDEEEDDEEITSPFKIALVTAFRQDFD